MKTKAIILMIMTFVVIHTLSAQESKPIKVSNYHLSNLTITSGKGAMTSGLDTRFDFSNEKRWVLFLQANADRATINFGRKFGKFQAIESFGVFKNMLWTGPMLLLNLGPIDMIAWNGLVFAKTDELKDPGYKPQFFCSYEGAGLTFCKNNHIGCAILYFGTAPMNWFVSYKRTINIGEKSKLFAEVTYNHDLNIPMFVIGYSMKIQ
ncbi:MAG: hypothetical protein WC875_04855 [Candidatus Absconditabacterales bacterium]